MIGRNKGGAPSNENPTANVRKPFSDSSAVPKKVEGEKGIGQGSKTIPRNFRVERRRDLFLHSFNNRSIGLGVGYSQGMYRVESRSPSGVFWVTETRGLPLGEATGHAVYLRESGFRARVVHEETGVVVETGEEARKRTGPNSAFLAAVPNEQPPGRSWR